MKMIYNEFKEAGNIVKINKVCLVDADFIKHITDSRAQKIIEAEMIDDVTTMKKVYRVEALGMCEDIEFKIRDPLVFCFSGKSYNTFRYKIAIAKEYKGSRKNTKLSVEEMKLKLMLMNEAMEAIINKYVCLLFDDLEADDLLAMLQDNETYIFSKDKDLLQIAGTHYNIQENSTYEISEDEAVSFLAHQLITGDSTDCITGIKGFGPEKAKKALLGVSEKSMISAVYQLYRKTHGIIKGTDLFCENWMLVKLRIAHGDHFMEKYKQAFELIKSIKKNNLSLNP